MRRAPTHFQRCPIASKFIDTREDAAAYYAYRLEGDHPVEVGGVALIVRFNGEETHAFTDNRKPCPEHHIVVRNGGHERRCLCIARARRMDLILPTVRKPAVTLRAKSHRGVMLIGPEEAPHRLRICVVVAPESQNPNVYFVRTLYDVSPKQFEQYRRSEPGVRWPPEALRKAKPPEG